MWETFDDISSNIQDRCKGHTFIHAHIFYTQAHMHSDSHLHISCMSSYALIYTRTYASMRTRRQACAYVRTCVSMGAGVGARISSHEFARTRWYAGACDFMCARAWVLVILCVRSLALVVLCTRVRGRRRIHTHEPARAHA